LFKFLEQLHSFLFVVLEDGLVDHLNLVESVEIEQDVIEVLLGLRDLVDLLLFKGLSVGHHARAKVDVEHCLNQILVQE
jgi:hypothetical protein